MLKKVEKAPLLVEISTFRQDADIFLSLLILVLALNRNTTNKLQVQSFLIHLACKSHTLKHNHYQNDTNKKEVENLYFSSLAPTESTQEALAVLYKGLTCLASSCTELCQCQLFPNIITQHLGGEPATLKTPGSHLPPSHSCALCGRGLGNYALQLLCCGMCTKQIKKHGNVCK